MACIIVLAVCRLTDKELLFRFRCILVRLLAFSFSFLLQQTRNRRLWANGLDSKLIILLITNKFRYKYICSSFKCIWYQVFPTIQGIWKLTDLELIIRFRFVLGLLNCTSVLFHQQRFHQ